MPDQSWWLSQGSCFSAKQSNTWTPLSTCSPRHSPDTNKPPQTPSSPAVLPQRTQQQVRDEHRPTAHSCSGQDSKLPTLYLMYFLQWQTAVVGIYKHCKVTAVVKHTDFLNQELRGTAPVCAAQTNPNQRCVGFQNNLFI